MNLRSLFFAAALIVLQWMTPAHAAFHLFRFEQVYSNADGSVQYVVIRESTGSNGENFWAGLQVRTTSGAGVIKTFTVPTNLPSSSTASRSVLIATAGFAGLGLATPDFTIPARFIPTEGGTLDYASGTDHINLPALPSDGVTAVDRNGSPRSRDAEELRERHRRDDRNADRRDRVLQPGARPLFHQLARRRYRCARHAAHCGMDADRLVVQRLSIAGVGRRRGDIGLPDHHSTPRTATRTFLAARPRNARKRSQNFPSCSRKRPARFSSPCPPPRLPRQGHVPVYRAFDCSCRANHRYTIRSDGCAITWRAIGWTIEGDGPDFRRHVRDDGRRRPTSAVTSRRAAAADAAAGLWGGYGPP
jgi:hypothetical protein